MNPQSERDRSIERLLRKSLATSPSAPRTGACLDAEVLAAWVEGALVGGQLAAAEEHVASCGFCQATLTALVRTNPPAVTPEPWWRRGLSARWLVPVAATATALAIWVAVPRDEFMRPPEQASTADAELTRQRTDVTTEPPAAVAGSAPSDTRETQPPQLEESTAERRLEAAQKAAPGDAVAERREAEAAPPGPQRSAAEPQLEAAAKPAMDAAGARPQEAPAPLGRAAAAPTPAAPAAAPAAAQTSAFGTSARAVTMPPRQVEIASPDGRARWRIGPAGAMEFSADAGSTWEARPSGVGVDLTAGTSPAETICWVVGRAGTVLLTLDGRQWRRLAFPLPVDLTAVQASDARTAIVTTGDGRWFRTMDAGASWQSP